MSVEEFDMIVVGAGQAGGPLAGAAARAGKSVALVENKHVGGTCVNEGCTPTKTMVASARVAHLARRTGDYGVESGPVGIDMATIRERKRSIVTSFRTGSERGLDSAGVELVMGTGVFTGPRRLQVLGNDGSIRELGAETVVINTGLVPRIPEIPGLDDVPYLTSTSIMELGEVPEHLIVMGGGYVGLEFAQMFRRFGAEVTILQRGEQLMPREDEEIAEAITDVLREDGCTVELAADVVEVSGGSGEVRVEFQRQERNSTVEGSHLLVAVGRRPDTEPMQLRRAGIGTTRGGFIKVNSKLATSADGVYAMGDVTGAPAFTHISYDDYRIARANLLENGRASRRGRIVPYTLFTDPQLGRIGITERDAIAMDIPHRVARLPMSRVARALETDETRGMMKAVVNWKNDRILGAAILGVEGGEVATMLQIAMMGKLPWQRLRDTPFSHPTWGEALNNLFMTL